MPAPSPPPAQGPCRPLDWALGAVLVLDAGIMAGLWCGGPDGLRLGALHLPPGWIDLAAPLAGMAAGALVLLRLGPRAVLSRALRATRARFAPASPLRRAQLLAAAVLTAAALDTAIGAPVQALRVRVVQASRERPALTHNRDHAHLPALVDAVVARPRPDPVVVLVEDDDPRGHVAAYYAYPRLLLMAPAQRAWTTRARMDRLGVPDPTLPPAGPAPGRRASQDFANQRGADLLVTRGSRLAGEPLP